MTIQTKSLLALRSWVRCCEMFGWGGRAGAWAGARAAWTVGAGGDARVAWIVGAEEGARAAWSVGAGGGARTGALLRTIGLEIDEPRAC